MNKPQRLLLAVLLLAFLVQAVAVSAEPVVPSRAEIIAEIEYARWAHQAWVEYLKANPDYVGGLEGDLAWQERWIRVYDWTIYYLRDGDKGPPRDWRIEQGLIKEGK